MNNIYFKEKVVVTPMGDKYCGLLATGEISAVVILRGGAIFEVDPTIVIWLLTVH